MVVCEGPYGEFQNSGLQKGSVSRAVPAGLVVTEPSTPS